MKIKEITYRNRRDFKAIYECEHCNYVSTEKEYGFGYDDRNFHDNVIPKFECKACGKKASESYEGMGTKYSEGYQI